MIRRRQSNEWVLFALRWNSNDTVVDVARYSFLIKLQFMSRHKLIVLNADSETDFLCRHRSNGDLWPKADRFSD